MKKKGEKKENEERIVEEMKQKEEEEWLLHLHLRKEIGPDLDREKSEIEGNLYMNGNVCSECMYKHVVSRRKERHARKRSDIFKGSLSEGQNKVASESDEELKDIEIPMDSDDEETQIRKRREARQKMLEKMKKRVEDR